MKKVLLLDENHPLLQIGLEELGFVCDKDYVNPKQAVASKMKKYTGIVIRSRFKIDKEFIDSSPNLRFIARVGAGLESIDTTYAAQKEIHLLAAPEGNRNAVGEHTLALLLSLFNKLNKADREIRQRKWLRESNRGLELDGKTVGIIGYGNMGKAFAQKLRGFDVKVICYDILPNLGDENCQQVSLKLLQEEADVVSIHTPHNELSYKMINTTFINAFKKSFFLLNTARGTAVVTADLVNALQTNKIIGAGLDVLEYEKTSFQNLFDNHKLPKAFDYLIQSENVILTPHIAGWTIESKIKLAQTIVDKISKLGLV
jgi:D-3-phosphoglycerate dehydrogenase